MSSADYSNNSGILPTQFFHQPAVGGNPSSLSSSQPPGSWYGHTLSTYQVSNYVTQQGHSAMNPLKQPVLSDLNSSANIYKQQMIPSYLSSSQISKHSLNQLPMSSQQMLFEGDDDTMMFRSRGNSLNFLQPTYNFEEQSSAAASAGGASTGYPAFFGKPSHSLPSLIEQQTIPASTSAAMYHSSNYGQQFHQLPSSTVDSSDQHYFSYYNRENNKILQNYDNIFGNIEQSLDNQMLELRYPHLPTCHGTSAETSIAPSATSNNSSDQQYLQFDTIQEGMKCYDDDNLNATEIEMNRNRNNSNNNSINSSCINARNDEIGTIIKDHHHMSSQLSQSYSQLAQEAFDTQSTPKHMSCGRTGELNMNHLNVVDVFSNKLYEQISEQDQYEQATEKIKPYQPQFVLPQSSSSPSSCQLRGGTFALDFTDLLGNEGMITEENPIHNDENVIERRNSQISSVSEQSNSNGSQSKEERKNKNPNERLSCSATSTGYTSNSSSRADVLEVKLTGGLVKKVKVNCDKSRSVSFSVSDERSRTSSSLKSTLDSCSIITAACSASSSKLLSQDRVLDSLKSILPNLPKAYMPFIVKKQSDNQKLEYLKRNHGSASQDTLNKLKAILPKDFKSVFDVPLESVLQNEFIVSGIKASLPDNSSKKIGMLTRKERNEKIRYYKFKRDKRAGCRKVSYDVRKRVADSRLRVKGRFVTKGQALQMIGDFSGDIHKYTNAELRSLLLQHFGSKCSKKAFLAAAAAAGAVAVTEDGIPQEDEEEEGGEEDAVDAMFDEYNRFDEFDFFDDEEDEIVDENYVNDGGVDRRADKQISGLQNLGFEQNFKQMTPNIS